MNFEETANSRRIGDFKNQNAPAGGYEVLATTVRENNCKIFIRKWLETNPFNEMVDFLRARIIGQENVILLATYVYRHLEAIANNLPSNNNVLLAAPSGCGKTETYRSLKLYFEPRIPDLIIYQMDMTSFNEESYTGNDTADILKPLFEDVVQNTNDKIAIIFLDEFDKKIVPTSKIQGENKNLFVQFKMLTMLEGRDVVYNKKGSKVMEDKVINTANCMFVGLGSYDEYRKMNPYSSDHYEFINKQSMVELGGSYELLGRFVDVINFHRLDEQSLNTIIDKIVVEEELSFGNKYKIILGENMRRFLVENANNEYGCRFLSSIIHQIVIKAYQYLLVNNITNEVNAVHIIDPDHYEVGYLDEEAEEPVEA